MALEKTFPFHKSFFGRPALTIAGPSFPRRVDLVSEAGRGERPVHVKWPFSVTAQASRARWVRPAPHQAAMKAASISSISFRTPAFGSKCE